MTDGEAQVKLVQINTNENNHLLSEDNVLLISKDAENQHAQFSN